MTERVYLPIVTQGGDGVSTDPKIRKNKIVIDPITRIEGHLRVEVEVKGDQVTDAWSAGTMFRGIELVLQGRDPRDAWLLTQRICGVCTTVHAICSVRAVENALGIVIPDNARLMRNLIEGAQFVQDHVIHFYHLHAPDWVDIVDALSADPAATSKLAQSVSPRPGATTAYFQTVQQRLQAFVDSGQLGIFANAYWGHPAYKLPSEGNLLAVAHYLEALDWQREAIKMHAILGGKNPHPQTYLVGGMALPVSQNSPDALNLTKIAQLRTIAQQALDFVQQVYLADLLLVGSYYKEWANLGGSPGHYLSYGDFPTDTSGNPSALWLPRGVVFSNDLSSAQSLDHLRIKEYVAHSWYSYSGGDSVGLHPGAGETQPNFTGPEPPYDLLDTESKYSWLKAPRYDGLPMEVGPLARMVVAYASGHAGVRGAVDATLGTLGLGPEALFSTLGRVAARGIETLLIAQQMLGWIDELEANIRAGRTEIHNGTLWDPASWPAEATGWGSTEAPRGGLGHWVQIQNGQIANYQAVVPTTWNGSPRDASGQRGVWEHALIGTPVADPEQPLEILRTVHSFDPCMACAVHILDADQREVTRVDVG
ncbi:MAG: nickel-dependent hydrogenase large subunit [Anaerolineae bacterium]